MKEYLLRKANMDGASNLKVWLLFVVVIAILGNSAGNNQYAARKLDDEIPGKYFLKSLANQQCFLLLLCCLASFNACMPSRTLTLERVIHGDYLLERS